MNLGYKLSQLENKITQASQQWQVVTARITALEDKVNAIERDLSAQLSGVKADINGLKASTSELANLIDADVDAASFTPSPAAPASETKSNLGIFFDNEGQTMVAARSGIREEVEERSYQIIGTLSKGNELFLKLRLVHAR